MWVFLNFCYIAVRPGACRTARLSESGAQVLGYLTPGPHHDTVTKSPTITATEVTAFFKSRKHSKRYWNRGFSAQGHLQQSFQTVTQFCSSHLPISTPSNKLLTFLVEEQTQQGMRCRKSTGMVRGLSRLQPSALLTVLPWVRLESFWNHVLFIRDKRCI